MLYWEVREVYSDENVIIHWVVQYQYEMTVIDIHAMHFNSLYSNKSFQQDIIAARVEISFWISETLFLNGTIYNTWTLLPPFLLIKLRNDKYLNELEIVSQLEFFLFSGCPHCNGGSWCWPCRCAPLPGPQHSVPGPSLPWQPSAHLSPGLSRRPPPSVPGKNCKEFLYIFWTPCSIKLTALAPSVFHFFLTDL